MSTLKVNTFIAVVGAVMTVVGAAVAATMMVKDVETTATVNQSKVGALEAAVIKMEAKLDYLVDGQSKLRADVQELKVGMGHVKERLRDGRPN
tara:strand:- start:3897 stop:4175 length:279 start_codon:yes stop_codon:yes gene_type:complete